MLSPFLSDASGRQHQPALIVHESCPKYRRPVTSNAIYMAEAVKNLLIQASVQNTCGKTTRSVSTLSAPADRFLDPTERVARLAVEALNITVENPS